MSGYMWSPDDDCAEFVGDDPGVYGIRMTAENHDALADQSQLQTGRGGGVFDVVGWEEMDTGEWMVKLQLVETAPGWTPPQQQFLRMNNLLPGDLVRAPIPRIVEAPDEP